MLYSHNFDGLKLNIIAFSVEIEITIWPHVVFHITNKMKNTRDGCIAKYQLVYVNRNKLILLKI